MKKILLLLLPLFLFSSCASSALAENTGEVPNPFFDSASVLLQWNDHEMEGSFSFSQEQLFHLCVEKPDALKEACYSFSPAHSTFSFADLSQDSLSKETPVFLFYRALCTVANKEAFTETENGFITNIGGSTLSVLTEENSITLITEKIKAVITLNAG